MTDNYADIINLPHHVSSRHTPMSLLNRAAQFAPFAALTGYDEAVRETARYTDDEAELDEARLEILNERLRVLQSMQTEQPVVTVTFFQSDERKSGGAYVAATGSVKKIDDYERTVTLTDGSIIPIDRIVEITGEVFSSLEK